MIKEITKQEKRYSTADVYESLGYYEHRKLKELISKNINIFESVDPVIIISEKRKSKVGGRPLESYSLTKNHLLILVSLIKNTSANVKVKLDFTRSFLVKEELEIIDKLSNISGSVDIEDEDSFIYVAKEEYSGRYKIGISRDPAARIKQLNTGNPEQLVLVHAYLATDKGNQSEIIAHKMFKHSRLKGEWFSKNIDISMLPSYVKQTSSY